MTLKGKKVVVVGLGRSGEAATKLLVKEGAEVWVTDRRVKEELTSEIERLKDQSIHFELGGHPPSLFSGAALAVLSPGVPTASLNSGGVPVIGEVELAFRYLSAPVAAITGTNGKSTTCALIGEIFKVWGKHVFVGGNFGVPLCAAAYSDEPWAWVVAEVSSFQMETITTFRPRIAVLLNMTPNHLDRYADFQDYVNAKLRIFSCQTADDYAVVNSDHETTAAYLSNLKSRVVGIGRKKRLSQGVWLEGDRLVSNLGGLREIIHRDEIPLRGEHNLENVMAAAATALLAGCPADIVRKGIRRFSGLEHRLEIACQRQGVLYVNDAKATTVSAVVCALKSFNEPVILIAGGQDKGVDFSPLRSVIQQKAKAVVLIGQAREKIRRAIEGTVPVHEEESLDDAVHRAAALAAAGDVVLMAPGCASFDMFLNFEDRGRQFKAVVAALP